MITNSTLVTHHWWWWLSSPGRFINAAYSSMFATYQAFTYKVFSVSYMGGGG
jgi:hypothetical protein